MADLMSDLVPASGSQIDLGNAYEVLAAIPAENLWLANFTSQNTRESYRRALGQFIALMGIDSTEALYWRVSDLLCNCDLIHASGKGSCDDGIQGNARRIAEWLRMP